MAIDVSALPAAVLLGLALSADAFAVALSQGVAAGSGDLRKTAMRAAFWFGGAQAGAALLGWLGGTAIARHVEAYDHWIAFGVLGALGVKLAHEGFTRDAGAKSPIAKGWAMAGLAVATSLDAVAAGLTLPTLGMAPLISAGVIGVITAAVCAIGVLLGQRAGARLGGFAEVLGGLILISLGVKILFEHRAFG